MLNNLCRELQSVPPPTSPKHVSFIDKIVIHSGKLDFRSSGSFPCCKSNSKMPNPKVEDAAMANKICTSKLSKELAKLRRDPLPNAVIQPNENNIREWHFCLLGHKDSPFKGGATTESGSRAL